MKSLRLKAILLSVLLLQVIWCSAQKSSEKTSATTKSAKTTASTAVYNPLLYSGMQWRCIGPYRGGRSLACSGVIGQPYIYYFGATGGGVWKTIDGGNVWFPVSDSAFHSASVGALAVAPSDPNVIYVGMGEAAIRNTAIMGDGIYKSIDAGKTWKHVLKLEASATGRIIVNPTNPNVAFAAVMGKMFGANKERGVYRTVDGGKTWQQVLTKDDSTGAIDVRFDPSNPNTIYASLWQVHRTAWKLSSGGPGSGLYKSTDGGDTWALLSKNPGMPKGMLGKICITISPVNPQRVWAMVENEHGGLFRSDDGGKTWSLVSSQNDLTQRPWYFSEIFADPKSENIVYVMNVQFWRSIDGGKTFSLINQEHGDNHNMWINPDNPDNFIISDDGSCAVTYNGGKTWTDEDIPTGQFYHVNLDNDFPYNAYGAQQDWGPVRIATRTTNGSITSNDWYIPAGGEAGYIVPKPDDPNITYGGEYDGLLIRHDKTNEQYTIVSVYPEVHDGDGASAGPYRFQWTYPIAFSPFDPNTIYCSSQEVHRSKNGGMSWENISPDLTRNDKGKEAQSGGPITPDNTGAEVYCDVYAFAESYIKPGLLWAGSDDGLVHVSRDDGKNWTDVTPKDFPQWATCSILEPSHFDSGTCFLAAHKYRVDDTKPYIYRTTDFGKTWTLIVSGLAANVNARCVREDPNRKGLLYAGTETGAYVSFDNGDRWQTLQLNLPVTPVHDMQIKKDQDELVIATHGRAFWVLDDLTPLYQIGDSIANKKVILYKPRISVRMDGGQTDPSTQDPTTAAQEGTNAPNGVIVNYYFKQKPKGEIRLEFLTSSNDSIITFSNQKDKNGNALKTKKEYIENPKQRNADVLPSDSGMNRFVWDMIYPDARHFDDDWVSNGSLSGSKALPGNYWVKLYTGDTLLAQQAFSIAENPKVKSTPAELKANFDLMQQINKKQNEITTSIVQIRSTRKQMNDFMGNFSDTNKIKSLQTLAKPILDSLDKIENNLLQTKIKAGEDALRFPIKTLDKLCILQDYVRASDAPPTQQDGEVFKKLSGDADTQLNSLKTVFNAKIPAYNSMVQQLQLLPVDPSRALKTAGTYQR